MEAKIEAGAGGDARFGANGAAQWPAPTTFRRNLQAGGALCSSCSAVPMANDNPGDNGLAGPVLGGCESLCALCHDGAGWSPPPSP